MPLSRIPNVLCTLRHGSIEIQLLLWCCGMLLMHDAYDTWCFFQTPHETTLYYSWQLMTVTCHTSSTNSNSFSFKKLFLLQIRKFDRKAASFTKVLWSSAGRQRSQRGGKKKREKIKQSAFSGRGVGWGGVGGGALKTPPLRSLSGFASCARSSANTEPGFRTSRSPGHGNRWMGRGSMKWWWWC